MYTNLYIYPYTYTLIIKWLELHLLQSNESLDKCKSPKVSVIEIISDSVYVDWEMTSMSLQVFHGNLDNTLMCSQKNEEVRDIELKLRNVFI